MKRFVRSLLVASAVAVLPVQAGAVPIDFFFTGTGTGSLDGVSFEDADYTVSVWADTDDVIYNVGAERYSVLAMSATIDIDGFSVATFTEEVGVVSNNDFMTINFTRFNGATPGPDLINAMNSAFATYDLQSSFSINIPWDCCHFNFNNVMTDLGLLSMNPGEFSSPQPGTFQAVLKQQVPEPATLAIFGLALGALGVLLRRRRVA